MQVPIVNKASNRLEINALFLQPTRYCKGSCKKCYIKAHQPNEIHTPYVEQCKLLEMFYKGRQAACNQITISIDELPEDVIKQKHMLSIFSTAMHLAKDSTLPSQKRPEIHLTMRHPDTLGRYVMDWQQLTGIDMISFSSLDSKGSIEAIRDLKSKAPHLSINWNLMMPDRWLIDRELLKFYANIKNIIPDLDSIYLLLRKSPIGAKRDLISIKKDREQMARDLFYTKLLQKTLPIMTDKLILDGCLQDVLKFRDTGFGCSSNVSRFQVWPDGSVTGCAYKHQSAGQTAQTAGQILDNIREAQNSYDFQECHLPEVINSVT